MRGIPSEFEKVTIMSSPVVMLEWDLRDHNDFKKRRFSVRFSTHGKSLGGNICSVGWRGLADQTVDATLLIGLFESSFHLFIIAVVTGALQSSPSRNQKASIRASKLGSW